MNDQHLDLDTIEARAQAATPGPWTVSQDYADILGPDGDHLASYFKTADGELIAHAREDIDVLGAEVRRLRQQRRLLLASIARKDAESGAGDKALREFLAAEETHVVADGSDDPEHVDDCPGCVPAVSEEQQ